MIIGTVVINVLNRISNIYATGQPKIIIGTRLMYGTGVYAKWLFPSVNCIAPDGPDGPKN